MLGKIKSKIGAAREKAKELFRQPKSVYHSFGVGVVVGLIIGSLLG